MALLVKERDGLKAILASYEEEEALDRSEQGKDSTEEARAAKAKIQQLETEVEAGRERERELEVRDFEARTCLYVVEVQCSLTKGAEIGHRCSYRQKPFAPLPGVIIQAAKECLLLVTLA